MSKLPFTDELPTNWDLVQNRFLFKENTNQVGEDFKNYQLLSLTTSGIKEKDINSTGGKVPDSYNKYLAIKKGQMVFCLFDLDVSAVFSGISHYDGMITSAYNAYNSTKLITNEFVNYWFQYVFTGRYYKMYSKNIRYTVTSDMFNSIKTPVPPLDVQIKISKILDDKTSKIDALIANEQQLIEKLKAYKQSLISEVVTKGLDPNAPMKDSGVDWIGKIPVGWKVAPLKTLFQFGKGLSITKADLKENGIKVISYGQVHSKTNKSFCLDDSLFRFVSAHYLTSNQSSLVSYNDFIVADTSEDLLGTGDFVRVSSNEKIFSGYHTIIFKALMPKYSKYLSFLFMCDYFRRQYRETTFGVKIYSLTQRMIATCTVLLPPLEIQEDIFAFLKEKVENIEKIISIENRKIFLLQRYKKSLIYEYVTGKKEVEK